MNERIPSRIEDVRPELNTIPLERKAIFSKEMAQKGVHILKATAMRQGYVKQ